MNKPQKQVGARDQTINLKRRAEHAVLCLVEPRARSTTEMHNQCMLHTGNARFKLTLVRALCGGGSRVNQ